MPVLAKETDIFPAGLLDAPESLAKSLETDEPAEPRRWRVVYTRSRQEKTLARHLITHQIPFYLPLVAQKRQARGRRVTSHLPLFTGYLFLYSDATERVAALTSNRISQILDVDDQATLLTDLRQVRRLIEADAPLTVEQRLAPGRRVRVKSGSLAGMEGTIMSRRSDCRLLVAVSYLNQGVSIQIDDFMVEPI